MDIWTEQCVLSGMVLFYRYNPVHDDEIGFRFCAQRLPTIKGGWLCTITCTDSLP